MSNQTNFTWNGANYCKSDYQNSCIVFVTVQVCVPWRTKIETAIDFIHTTCNLQMDIRSGWRMADAELKIIYQIHDLSHTCLADTIPNEEYKFTQCRQHWSLSEQTSEWVVSGPPGTDALALTDIAFDICGKGGRWTHKKWQTRHATETDIQRRKTWLLWSMCLLVLQLYHFIFY